ncbi:MAG: outer membrane beta-barrel protein [Gemmatimonadota bacterium]
MNKRTLLAALAAFIPLTAPASAQEIHSPYDFVDPSMEFWAFGSAVFTDRGTIDIGPGSGYAGGLGFTVRISGPFNFDTRVAYLPTSRHVYTVMEGVDPDSVLVDPMLGLEQVGEADLSLLLLDASLRFDVTGPRTWYRLQPYALIGVGGVLAAASDNDAEENLPEDADLRVRFRNGFTGHVGAGVEVYLSDRFTVRAEGRDLLWKIHVPDGFFTEGRVIDDEEWVQTGHVSLGLAFRF